jgi:ATP adenylyltransferase
MTSFSATAPLDCRSNALLDLSEKTIRNALATGALQPIATESTTLAERGFSFSVRWVSSLALKDRARVDTVTRKRPEFNPFLPPEPALTVAHLGSRHLVVLNKFPVIDHHLLIVTRAFEAQTAPLTPDDFRALATVIGAQGGLGFYNGGSVAGASQPHKHLQWVPEASLRADDGFASFSRGLDIQRTGEAQSKAELPWQHAFMSLADVDWCDAHGAGEKLQHAFETACRALALPSGADPMPPYNLLASRQWLLVVPRQFEKWQDVSVNALGYAGSLFVRSREQIERVRTEGPLSVLRAVGYPR